MNADTQLLVSAEVNDPVFPGMLRARATTVGNSEKFVMYNLGGDTKWFTGSPGYLVTSEMNYSGSGRYMLRAARRTPGPWEHWAYYPL